MNPKRVLSKETVILNLRATTKEALIEELVDVLAQAGRIKDRKAALKAVLERERKMSTGLQNGIAIPHGKTDTVESLVAALGIAKTGIDFDSLDGQPCHIFLMTLSPASRTGPHIQFLADISRTLHDAAIRQQVLDATSEELVVDLLCRDRTAPPAA
ncbi:MAG TPA: PTS sugar transporter subunit IIA [Kiritimatiellia bacterium]|nr:PTS sugar transporter subunit IIA [Kiritimatiellia bacterium]